MTPLHDNIERFTYVINTVPSLLHKLDEHIFSIKPATEKWSKKEGASCSPYDGKIIK